MPYFRLLRENELVIIVSNDGIEIPGAECVQIVRTKEEHHGHLATTSPTVYRVTFENGRVVRTKAQVPNYSDHQHILKKI